MPEVGRGRALFAGAGWQPFAFQREVWQAMAAGRSGLLHASTGSGKTYAVWWALLRAMAAEDPAQTGLRILWLTPMRALAADTARALAAAAGAGAALARRAAHRRHAVGRARATDRPRRRWSRRPRA